MKSEIKNLSEVLVNREKVAGFILLNSSSSMRHASPMEYLASILAWQLHHGVCSSSSHAEHSESVQIIITVIYRCRVRE